MRKALFSAASIATVVLTAAAPALAEPNEAACANDPHGTEVAHDTVPHNTEGNHTAHMNIPHFCDD